MSSIKREIESATLIGVRITETKKRRDGHHSFWAEKGTARLECFRVRLEGKYQWAVEGFEGCYTHSSAIYLAATRLSKEVV